MTTTITMSAAEMTRQGAEWARTQPSPWISMRSAFDSAQKLNPAIEWMPWTLGYCRQLCGAFVAKQGGKS